MTGPPVRKFPARVPDLEYPQSMVVRSVHAKGYFRWKKHDVFLSEVLWGESVGLLPEDDHWFTIYFAHLPLARFDSYNLQVIPCKTSTGFYKVRAGEGEQPPSPDPIPRPRRTKMCQECARSKMSGMPPSVHSPQSKWFALYF